MAKRKLSPEDRQAVRTQIAQALKRNVQQSEILKAVSKKYSISKETARWYLNSLKGPAKRKKKVFGKKAGPRRRKTSSRRSQKPSPARRAGKRKAMPPTSTVARISQVVRTFSTRALKKALSAKALLPKLDRLTKRENLLRKAQEKATNALNAASKETQKLRGKISRILKRA